MSFTPKAILFLLICTAVTFFVQREEDGGAVDGVNRTYVDWLRGNSKQQLSSPSVTLLSIDEEQAPILQNWPPEPLDFSIMLRRLQLCEPKVVAAEPALKWDDADEGQLEILRTAGLKFDPGQLLLGSVLQYNQAAPPLKPSTLSLLRPLPAENIEGEVDQLPEFTTVASLPDRRLTAIGAPVGFTEIDLGDEAPPGSALSAPLLARAGNTVIPSFVLLATMLDLDASPADLHVRLGHEITIKGELSIPIDSRGSLKVFTDLRPSLPVSKASILVLDPSSDGGGAGGQLGKEERMALESRIVVLGMNDENSRVIPLGGGAKISRAELFALAIATIQSGRYIDRVAPSVKWAICAFIVLLGLLLIRMPRKRGFGLALLAVILYFIGNMILFQSTPRWVPPAVPLALLACVLLATLTLGAAGGRQAEASGSDGE